MKLSRWIAIAIQLLAIWVLAAMCLAFDWLRNVRLSWFGLDNACAEVFATVHSPDLQWLVTACISVYCICFAWLDLKMSSHGRDWLFLGLALLGLGAVSYARDYAHGSATTDTLVFFFGLALFGGISCWRASATKRSKPLQFPAVLLGFVLLLFCLALGADQQTGQAFNYSGHHRWSGLWDNPNMSGVLMATGLVLAVGWAVSSVRCRVSGIWCQVLGGEKGGSRKLTTEIGYWAGIALLGIAAIICSIGLIKSYCRGAWVGAVCGLAYLGWQGFTHLTPAPSPRPTGGEGESSSAPSAFHVSCSSIISRFKRIWLPVAVILISVLMLAFWNFRHTEHVPIRRIASAANANDFSSRNRMAAWEGALQMAAEKPLFGVGWNMQDYFYDQFYLAAGLNSFAAVRTNDFLKLANTLGNPALFCFVAFVGLAMTRNSESRTRNAETEPNTSPQPSPQSGEGVSSRATRHTTLALACRAGVVVLLVSFWFDGADSGLFRLASGSLFWILLALGSVEERVGS